MKSPPALIASHGGSSKELTWSKAMSSERGSPAGSARSVGPAHARDSRSKVRNCSLYSLVLTKRKIRRSAAVRS
jgi:hypothetical protein